MSYEPRAMSYELKTLGPIRFSCFFVCFVGNQTVVSSSQLIAHRSPLL